MDENRTIHTSEIKKVFQASTVDVKEVELLEAVLNEMEMRNYSLLKLEKHGAMATGALDLRHKFTATFRPL